MSLRSSSALATLAGLGVAFVAIAQPASAQVRPFNVPAQNIQSAIQEISRQADVQILAAQKDLAGRQSQTVKGEMDVRAALDQALKGTGLVVGSHDGRTIVLRLGAQAPASSGATASVSLTTAAEPFEDLAEEVIVTGSRIARRDYIAESPTVTLRQQALQVAGPATLEQTLNQMPQFAANGGASSASSASGGRANANLRGLGIARTLVMMDGRRMQASDPLGAVDLNTVPTALIRDVEIITGGASAVYGSDAIAGVVNFKLKNNFQGFEFDTQYGQSDRSDAASVDISLLTGGNFANDRGNAVLSLSYFKRDQVLRRNRPFFRNGGVTAVIPSGLIAAQATNLPSQAAVDAVFGAYGVAPGLRTSSTYGTNPDGTLFTLAGPIVNFRYPDDGPYIISNGQVGVSYGEHGPLQQPMDRQNVFGRATYKLTDRVEAYAQFNYTHYTADINAIGRNQAITRDVYLPMSNPYIPDDLRTLMASRPNPNAPLLFYFNTSRFAPALTEQTYDVFQGTTGLNGMIETIDGSWDVYASYGRTERNSTARGHVDRQSFLNLIEAADGGVSICEGGLKPLEISKPSADCLAYLLREVREQDVFEQSILEGSVQGRLFSLPAGDVRFAAGVGHRRNTYAFRPDQQRVFGTVLASSLSSPTNGVTETTEVFGEALIPVLRDLPLVQELNLSLAYRYSDYNTIGGVSTYKLAADWSLNPAFKLRGGYQRAIRAPSVGELYAPAEESGTVVGRTAAGRGDPCDITTAYRNGSDADKVRALCIANGIPENVIDTHRFVATSVQSKMSGNPDLREEVADTYTAGLVWRPRFDNPWLSSLSGSVDYYNIKLEDAIGLITGEVIAQRCFNGQGNSNPDYDPQNYYCQLIHRGPSGGFATIDTPLLNLGGYETAGFDLQVDWGLRFGDIGLDERLGHLSLNFIASYLDKYAIQTLPGGSFVDYAGTIGNAQISSEAISHPEWRTVTSLNWRIGQADVGLRWRWVDAMDNSTNVGASVGSAPGVTGRQYFDVTARYRLNNTAELRAGVINLADTEPPEWTGESATDAALYDVLGRRFHVGLNLSF